MDEGINSKGKNIMKDKIENSDSVHGLINI